MKISIFFLKSELTNMLEPPLPLFIFVRFLMTQPPLLNERTFWMITAQDYRWHKWCLCGNQLEEIFLREKDLVKRKPDYLNVLTKNILLHLQILVTYNIITILSSSIISYIWHWYITFLAMVNIMLSPSLYCSSSFDTVNRKKNP